MTTPEPPHAKYTVPSTETKLGHNVKSQEALTFLEQNPEISEWLRTNYLAEVRNEIENILIQAGWDMTNQLMQFGVQLCPHVSSVWLSNKLESSLRGLTEFLAGYANSQGDSKATLSKAINIAPQSFNIRFPQATEIAKTQDHVEQTGIPETIKLRGEEFTIYPPHNNEED